LEFLGKCPVWQTGHFVGFSESGPSHFHDPQEYRAEIRLDDNQGVEPQARVHNLLEFMLGSGRTRDFFVFPDIQKKKFQKKNKI
jgi:hypothetical protein